MESSFLVISPGYVTVALLLIAVTAIWTAITRRGKQMKLPPGPPGWPIIGNLLVIFKPAKATLDDFYFSKCAREYGDVYSLRLGSKLMYVLSNIDHIREVFSNSKVMARLPAEVYRFGIGPGAKGIIFASGPEWSVMRKFILALFRDLGVGKGLLDDTIQSEIERLIAKLDGLTNMPCWDVKELLYSAACNTMCGMIFGHKYDYEDPEFKEVIRIIEETPKNLGPGAMVINSEILCRFPFGPGRRLITDIEKFKVHLKQKIGVTKAQPEDQRNSFVKAFLVEMEKNETYFDEDNLIATCFELFLAGTETISGTLAWGLLYLTTHPTVQGECQRELDEYIKERGMPRYSDRYELPYTQSVIMEIQRLASVSQTGLPHRVTEDLHLLGYDFPKDTLVIGNLQGINMDEERFPKPSEFIPERYLEDGRFVGNADIIPFLVGRRACPGESLSRIEVFLMVVSLLHRYTFSPPEDIEMPDHKQALYGSIRQSLPFAVVIKKR